MTLLIPSNEIHKKERKNKKGKKKEKFQMSAESTRLW